MGKEANQRFFDVVWQRAKDPRRSSRDSGGHIDVCYYRHPWTAGLACFVGAAIPDEQYDPTFERKSVEEIHSHVPALRSVSQALLVDCQMVHDSSPPAAWEVRLRYLACTHGLVVPD